MANIESPEDRVPRRLDQRRRSAAGRERQSAQCHGSDRASCDSVGQHRSAPSRLSVARYHSLASGIHLQLRARDRLCIRRAADHNCAEPIVQTIPLWKPWRCCSRSSRSNLYWQILNPQKIVCRDASISVVARLQVVSDKVHNATAPTELRTTASDSIAVRRLNFFVAFLCKLVHMLDKTCTMCLKCSSLLIEEFDVQVN